MNEEKINNTFHSLKEKREALGLTLKNIFQRTRITAANLEAIENGDLHLLPVPIYTRNFIKTYARALGVDSEPLLASYENYLNSLQVVETPSLENIPENISYLDKIVEYKAYLWTAAALIFIVIVSLLIFLPDQPANYTQNDQAEKIAAVEPESKADPLFPSPRIAVPATEQTKAIPQPVSNEANKTNPIPTKPTTIRQETAVVAPATSVAQKILTVLENKEVSPLIIKATEDTWLRIQTDQNPSYQVLLKAGEKIVRKAASVEMDIGNAGGITIQFKGKNIENIGKSGEVIHLRLP